MKDFIFMSNLVGRIVEVAAEKQEELTRVGFKIVTSTTISLKNQSVNMSIPTNNYKYGGYGRVEELLRSKLHFSDNSANVIYFGYPQPIKKEAGKKYFLITAWEADQLPANWKELCSYFDVIIVPSRFNQALFKKNGIENVETMIQGTDNFEISNPTSEYPFTFLHYNSFSDNGRKGWDLVAKAFLNVFGRYPKIQLILKGRNHDNDKDIDSIPKTPNIQIIVEDMNRLELTVLQNQTHCFVFPSRGEGIGLTPLEMMARGIPTIVSNGSGMKEYASFGIPLNHLSNVPAIYPRMTFDKTPHWHEPNLFELEDKMFYAYRNYAKVKEQAIKNAEHIKRFFNSDITATSFVNIVKKYE